MTNFYEHAGVTLYHGHVLDVLRDLPDETVDCVVTSPPYYNCRDYGTATWEGGLPDCEHFIRTWDGPKQTQGAQNGHAAKRDKLSRDVCECGARRIDLQIGLEDSPFQYIAKLVEVFEEVRRVLKSAGSCFLNLGDSYAGSWGNQGRKEERGTQRPINGPMIQNLKPYPIKQSNTGKIAAGSVLKPKDLMMIPHRTAIALQEAGWWVRADNVWSKRNCMVESVSDRTTRSHEYVFHLAKSSNYDYDQDAIREPFVTDPSENPARATVTGRGDQGFASARGNDRGKSGGFPPNADGRNRRSVWSITSKPSGLDHYATMPEELARICILAGCLPGGTVLDPFSGAGTTALVAKENGRQCIGIDLNEDYLKMSVKRLGQDVFSF